VSGLGRWFGAFLLSAGFALSPPIQFRAAAATPRAPIRLTATLSPLRPQVRGSVETVFTNTSTGSLREVVVMLFPNRFRVEDAGINDWNRPFVFPGEDFDPGGIEIGDVRAGGAIAAVSPLDGAGLPEDWGLRLSLPAPLPPGDSISVGVDFSTTLPERFGPFGEYERGLTALGGWYPYIPALRQDGTWAFDALPPLGDFEVEIGAGGPVDAVLNGHWLPRLAAPERVTVGGVHYLSLVSAPVLLRDVIPTVDGRVAYVRRPPLRHDRIAPGPSQDEIMRDALGRIVERRPAVVPPPARELVIVEAPLRMDLTEPGEGMAVISDRALRVLGLLRPFHEVQVAREIHAELERGAVAGRESPDDYAWVSQGLAHETARAYAVREFEGVRSVRGWIELFNIFAIVDRFETAPKIPFVAAYLEQQPVADPLHQRISTWNNDLPPGHVILGKLRQLLGEPIFGRVVATCARAPEPFRRCAARESGRDLDGFFEQWVRPYPEMNYSFGELALNRRRGEAFVARLTVERESSRAVVEPVEVHLRGYWDDRLDLLWDGPGAAGHLEAESPFRVRQVAIDPARKLIETTRADNARPPELQVILDTAEVEVSSTEFGVSGLAVARGRYDWKKDIAVAGVWTNRGIGMTAGGRYHWGEPIDPVFYPHNLYAFYAVQALDSSFQAKRDPAPRTAGHVNGVGVRYDFNNILSYDNPTHEVQVQLFADWFDRSLGSDYDYTLWGGSAILTHPLWSYRTLLAGEVFNGFGEALGSSVVPNQLLYSLGGSRSIRGIGVQEELGRNIFLLRAELRHTLEPELDLNMLDLAVWRRVQLRPFVDTGRVSNAAGAVYDPSGWSFGFGLGFGVFYDFMGFFPSLAYLEVATSADRPSDVQVLFGTRQSF
jgi:hypothetical protein